jgi:hypothetical protein
MTRSVQETSRIQGNYIIEYGYIGREGLRRTPMIGYYRCWASTAQEAKDGFMHTQRYYRNDCCSVLNVWRQVEEVA